MSIISNHMPSAKSPWIGCFKDGYVVVYEECMQEFGYTPLTATVHLWCRNDDKFELFIRHIARSKVAAIKDELLLAQIRAEYESSSVVKEWRGKLIKAQAEKEREKASEAMSDYLDQLQESLEHDSDAYIIHRDLASDREDFSRSHDEGWFYDDSDPD